MVGATLRTQKVVFYVSSPKIAFFGHKRANFGPFWPKNGRDRFADQLIILVSLGTHAVSRKAPIYFTISTFV